MHWQRTFLHPMLANFDAPAREDMRLHAERVEHAAAGADAAERSDVRGGGAGAGRSELLASAMSDDDARLDVLYQRALAAIRKAKERESLMTFLAAQREYYQDDTDDAAKLTHVGIAPAGEATTRELAAWTSVCRVILNLHETITRY